MARQHTLGGWIVPQRRPTASISPLVRTIVAMTPDATFEKVRGSGAEVLQEPVSQPWGARDYAFRDPSGNLVRIAQA